MFLHPYEINTSDYHYVYIRICYLAYPADHGWMSTHVTEVSKRIIRLGRAVIGP